MKKVTKRLLAIVAAVALLVTTGGLPALGVEGEPFAHFLGCPETANVESLHRSQEDCFAAIDLAELQKLLDAIVLLPAPDSVPPFTSEQRTAVEAARLARAALEVRAQPITDPAVRALSAVAKEKLALQTIPLQKLEKLVGLAAFTHAADCPDRADASSAHRTVDDCRSALAAAEQKKADAESAAKVVALVQALPAPEGLTGLTDAQKQAVQAAQTAYAALNPAAKALVAAAETTKLERLAALLNLPTVGVGPVLLTHDGQESRHATIAVALQAAATGDTLTLDGGTYAESLTLEKAVTIKAASANRPKVNGVWSIKGDALLENLDFVASSALGVLHLDAGMRLTLRNATVEQLGSGAGILVGGSSGSAFGAELELDNVILHANAGGRGIDVRDASTLLTIKNRSEITGVSAVYIGLPDSTSQVTVKIDDSRLTGQDYALRIGNASAVVGITNSTLAGNGALVLQEGSRSTVTVTSATLEGGSTGALLVDSAENHLTVAGNSVLKNKAGVTPLQPMISFGSGAQGLGAQVALDDVTLIDDSSGKTAAFVGYGGRARTSDTPQSYVLTTGRTQFLLSGSGAPIIEVDLNGGFHNAYGDLQAAVNAAADGSILKLSAGSYAVDSLEIGKPNLTLRGADSGTAIAASGAGQAGIWVKANNIALENLKITYTGSGYPLQYFGGSPAYLQGGSLRNVTLSGGNGLSLQGVKNLSADGLRVLDSKAAGVNILAGEVTLRNSAFTGGRGDLGILAATSSHTDHSRVTLGAGNSYGKGLLYSEWGSATADPNRVDGVPTSWSMAQDSAQRRTTYQPAGSGVNTRIDHIRIADGSDSFNAMQEDAYTYSAVVSKEIVRGDIQLYQAASVACDVGAVAWNGTKQASVKLTVGGQAYTLRLVCSDVTSGLDVTGGSGSGRTENRRFAQALEAGGITVSSLANAVNLYADASNPANTRIETSVEIKKTLPENRNRVPSGIGSAAQKRRVETFLEDEGYLIAEVLEVAVRKHTAAGGWETLSRLERPLQFTYTLPSIARERKAYRVLHLNATGGMDVFTPTLSGSRLSFESDSFSPFLVVYSTKSTSSSGSSGGGSSGPSPAELNARFWETVQDKIYDADAGELIKANAAKVLNVPAGVLRELRGRDVTLVISYRGGSIVIYGKNMLDVPKNRVYYSFEELARLYKEVDATASSGSSGPEEIYHPGSNGGSVGGVTPPTAVVNPPAAQPTPPASDTASASSAQEELPSSEPEAESEPEQSEPEKLPADAEPEKKPEKRSIVPLVIAAAVAAVALLAGVAAFAFYRFKRED